jgi:precorrin-4 methylase
VELGKLEWKEHGDLWAKHRRRKWDHEYDVGSSFQSIIRTQLSKRAMNKTREILNNIALLHALLVLFLVID